MCVSECVCVGVCICVCVGVGVSVCLLEQVAGINHYMFTVDYSPPALHFYSSPFNSCLLQLAENDQKLYRSFNLLVVDKWQAEMMGERV